MTETADIIIIGSGMPARICHGGACGGGARRVLLLEMESQAGYHATGRSAAMYEPAEAIR
jgi:D-arginine dehydrogenase